MFQFFLRALARRNLYKVNNSPRWGLNPGPSDYKSDALPLSYEGCWMVPKHDTIDKSRKKQNQNNHDSASGNVVRNSDCPGATCYIPSVRKQFDTHSTLITEFPIINHTVRGKRFWHTPCSRIPVPSQRLLQWLTFVAPIWICPQCC